MTPPSGRQIISPTFYDRQLPRRRLPRQNTDVWIGYFPNIPHLQVCWLNAARLQILRHAYRTPDIEVGGILLGGVYRSVDVGHDNLPVDFIQITYAVPSAQTTRESGSFTFTAESWAEMNSTVDHMIKEGSLSAESRMVGWYHTHPGHGVFLSGHDLFIQNNFFSTQFQCALVIETKEHQGAFFVDTEASGGPYQSEKFTWEVRLSGPETSSLSQEAPSASADIHVHVANEEPAIYISSTELNYPELHTTHQNIPPARIALARIIVSAFSLAFALFFLLAFSLSLIGGPWLLPFQVFFGVLLLISLAVLVWQLVPIFRELRSPNRNIVIEEQSHG